MSYKYEYRKPIPGKYIEMGHPQPYNPPCCSKGSNERTFFDIQQMKRTDPNVNKKQNYVRQHGFAHFHPNDPVYKPIGGAGGLGWL